jgi:hypothetical protein
VHVLRVDRPSQTTLSNIGDIGYHTMKVIVGTLIAFLLGSVLISNKAEARCWWNGYNHCGYHHQVYHHHGYYGHAWNHDYHGHDYWYR